MKMPWSVLFAVSLSFALPALAQEKGQKPSTFKEVTTYDPGRNAEKDLADSIAEAKRTGKHIFLSVGGDWCEWCKILDDFYAQNAEIATCKARNYIALKITFGPKNHNTEVLSRFPKIQSYPHFFILNSDGSLLYSQDTTELERGKSYDAEKFLEFLQRWVPDPKDKKKE